MDARKVSFTLGLFQYNGNDTYVAAPPKQPQQIYESGSFIEEYYEYLSKPRVVIKPTGHIIIDFGSDWTHDDKTNFLTDMKAKAIKEKR